MSFHPTGITVEIQGIEIGGIGCSCEDHDICGSILHDDIVVRLRREQILVENREKLVIAAYWVSDSIIRCRVGFLKNRLLEQAKAFLDGLLAQVMDIYEKDTDCPVRETKCQIFLAAVKLQSFLHQGQWR